jgi:hypothetical protein
VAKTPTKIQQTVHVSPFAQSLSGQWRRAPER